jgi:hypothetical protein
MLRLWILPVLVLIAVLGFACGDSGDDLSASPTNLIVSSLGFPKHFCAYRYEDAGSDGLESDSFEWVEYVHGSRWAIHHKLPIRLVSGRWWLVQGEATGRANNHLFFL